MPSPQPEILELSMPQAAAVCGVAYDTLLKYLNSPDPPPRLPNKKFRSDELGEWLRRRSEAELSTNSYSDSGRINGSYERARKTKEMADKLQLENKVRRGELVEASDVEAMWSMVLMRVRTRILAIPTSLAPQIATEDDACVCQELLGDQCREALEELSRGWEIKA